MNKELLTKAGFACVEIYLQQHPMLMKEKPEAFRKAWSIGQELYLEDLKNKSTNMELPL
jgi:hypothetical protein